MKTKKPYKLVTTKQKKVLPKDLRAMPGEIVTTEVGDETKVHEHDPRHIRLAIVKAAAKKEKTALGAAIMAEAYLKTFLYKVAQSDKRRPVDQASIDLARGWLLAQAAKKAEIDFRPRYVWMPEARGWTIMVKPGYPMTPSSRPKHLKHAKLELDLLNWPQRVVDLLKEAGINFAALMADIEKNKKQHDFWKAVERASGSQKKD